MKLIYIPFILVLFFSNTILAQIAKGEWRDHLPYTNAHTVAIAGSTIYCATDLSLFSYNTSDNSITRMSKVSGLSDIEVGSIAYSDTYDALVIGYTNGNIDIIKSGTIYNLFDLKEKDIMADKGINHIDIVDNLAYLACNFGIVVLDIDKMEFTDSYVIGSDGTYININATAIFNDTIFALTDNGILKVNLNNQFLSYYQNWSLDSGLTDYTSNFTSATLFNNKLYVSNINDNEDTTLVQVYDGTSWTTVFDSLSNVVSVSSSNNQLIVTYAYHVTTFDNSYNVVTHMTAYNGRHALCDENNTLWVADHEEGLIKRSASGKETIVPSGPSDNDVFKLEYNNGEILVAPGGYAATGANIYRAAAIYSFKNETWSSITRENSDSLSQINDLVNFGVQSGNSKKYYAATWGYGLLQIENNAITRIYNAQNTDSILSNSVGDCEFDDDGNLWIVNRGAENPVVVKTAEGEWYNMKYGGVWSDIDPYQLIYTQDGNFWNIGSKGYYFVWNSNGTPETESDDSYIRRTLIDSEGNTLSSGLNDIVEDEEGAIWIATDNGVGVYDSPSNVFSSSFYARVPAITVDGTYRNLLEGESVTCIAVDGANRKWFGTNGSGIFLVSADGTEQLLSYNTENSPLFSDIIYSMVINDKTGELFIGTDKGIISFMTTATKGNETFTNVYAFPNPVKADYDGLITIRGLMYETNVKITDLSGQLVYETISNGGDCVWNGKNMSGETVSTGIYLVLCCNTDGTETAVTKILVVK